MIAGLDDHAVKAAPALERVGDFATFLGEDFDEALEYAALRPMKGVPKVSAAQSARPNGSKA